MTEEVEAAAAEATLNARSGTFWLGVTLSLCGSLCSALGLACQRLSHKRNNELPPEQQKRSSRQWLNLLGVFLLFIESIFDLVSFGFAPASILSCMGAMTLVFNMMLAPAICGETVSKRDIGVNTIVFIGTIISVWFGPHATPDYDLDQLLSFFLDARFIIYAILLISWIIALMFVWFSLKDIDQPRGRFTNMDRLTRTRLLRFTYPALAGSIGGNTAVYAKASIELVKTTIKGNNQFKFGGTYFMIALMIVCVVAQLKFLNGGLKRYESLYVVPVYQVFWITCGVLGALFYFNEVAAISKKDLGLFCLGAIISIFGILLHSTRKPQQDASTADKVDAFDEAFDDDFDVSSCATPVKAAFDVVEESYNDFYATTDVSSRSDNNDDEPMLKNVDSLESFKDDVPNENDELGPGDSFIARRRRFETV